MLEFIPSPSQGVWYIGPIPIRGYALSILAGITVAFFVARLRWKRWGGDVAKFENLTILAIIIGIVGARIYWIIIEWPRFFGADGTWYHIFFVWRGGLGIWGGITFGFLSAFLLCKYYKFSFLKLADAVAPAFLIAQGIGRIGNWWNQELYGLPTTLPWGLEIDRIHRVPGFESFETFHPTFLYEMLWNFAGAALILILEERLRLGRGKVFALYVMVYATGRFWIELLRIDPVESLGPMRVNSWVTLTAGLVGLALFLWLSKRKTPPNEIVATEKPAKRAKFAQRAKTIDSLTDTSEDSQPVLTDDSSENVVDESPPSPPEEEDLSS
ncbi:MAG: prolipoprotein diacylglyceryl transferase [Propionibacteriaceae bacterium]|nr:prolipoprotein diacylglyceryl transferase [Propionibacteriaceae bacterium]